MNTSTQSIKRSLRLVCLLLLLALTLPLLYACDGDDTKTEAPTTDAPTDTTVVRVGGMMGATTIGMVKMLNDDPNGTKYAPTITSDAQGLAPLLIKGELDVAAVPANLAPTLYKNSNGKIQVAAINTLGVLSIVERGNTIQSLSDLRGKTIYATGKGTVPEFTLRYLLTQNGVDPDTDVTFVWKSQPQEVLAYLKSEEGVGGIAMLPQPFVTAATKQVADLRIATELNDEWVKLENGSTYVTGVLVVRRAFAEEHPEALNRFLTDYAASIAYVSQNPEEMAPVVERYIGVGAPIAKAAIPYCNLKYIDGADMKTALSSYLNVLFEMNPASIGGTMPDDAFYFTR